MLLLINNRANYFLGYEAAVSQSGVLAIDGSEIVHRFCQVSKKQLIVHCISHQGKPGVLALNTLAVIEIIVCLKPGLHASLTPAGCKSASSLAASRDVQHPERHFQNPRCLEVFQAAVRHRLAAFYEGGMNTYRSPMPWVPRVADFTEIPNMGVVLLSCIMAIERMRGWKDDRQTRLLAGLSHQ